MNLHHKWEACVQTIFWGGVNVRSANCSGLNDAFLCCLLTAKCGFVFNKLLWEHLNVKTNSGYEPNSVKLWRVVVVMVGVVHYGISIGYGV